jgi:hypothetical protein
MRIFRKNIVSFGWIATLTAFVLVLSSCSNETTFIDPGNSSLTVGNLKGVVRGNGALIEGANVSTIPPTISDTTSAIGGYMLDGLPAQSLQMVVEASGFVTDTRSVSVVAGKTYSVDFSLVPSTSLGHLTGTITDGFIPLSEVSVSTVPPSFSSLTGADGRYDYNNVTAGIYKISAFRVGFWPVSIFTTAENGLETIKDIALARRTDGVISGVIIDSAGTPISGASVFIFWDEEYASTLTGSDGVFSFGNLTTGYYIVTASSVNYYNGSHSLRAYGGVESNGTVVMTLASVASPVPGAVAGTVWDQDYYPVSGAIVTLDEGTGTPVTTATLTDGTYYFSGVVAGTHSVSAAHPDYTGSTISVGVGSNLTADATFALKKTG